MGFLIKVERYDQANRVTESREFSTPDWVGLWEAVEGEMDATGQTPSGMEGWNEGGCVGGDHDCDERPDQCREYLKDAVREWIESVWESDELRTGSFHFSGSDWSSITYGWDGN